MGTHEKLSDFYRALVHGGESRVRCRRVADLADYFDTRSVKAEITLA